MVGALVSASVRHAHAVVALALGVVAVALGVASRLPVDVFPDLEGTRVTVMTEAPGLATEEVERLVTMPVERALLGARGVERVRSTSVSGVSITYVDFEEGAAIEAARQRVSERLTTVSRDLPPGLVPAMGPEASLTGEIVQVTLVDEGGDPESTELRAWAADRGEPWFVFEAFDEPWKGSEDPREVEKHWGLYTVDRAPKIAMQPPAVQEPMTTASCGIPFADMFA